jgi:uncharacterized PurR-regulated membrane protein YhhQ (DUF165 family)
MIADIATGHHALADVLYLIAFVLFVLEAVAIVVQRPAVGRGILIAAGLACLALAFLVL